jgi:1,2-phenylacetyl-CoA epoxidase catalytic subunit
MIPTAEELMYNSKYNNMGLLHYKDAAKVAVELCKLHVEAALKTASEKAETDYTYEGESGEFEDIPVFNYFVDKDSILNAYPLTNVK